MAKTIILKNVSPNVITLPHLGEELEPSLGSPEILYDLSHVTSKEFRREPNLKSYIENGDILVSDGNSYHKPYVAYEYLVNDIVSDEDGFWYGYRRRFTIIWRQPNHNFSVGHIITLDNANGVAKLAIADSHENSATTSIVTELIDNDSFYAGLSGAVVKDITQSVVVEPLPFTVGKPIFLSSTQPGMLTINPPTEIGEIVKLVGVATGPNEMIAFTYPGYELETSIVSTNNITNLSNSGNIIHETERWKTPVISHVDDISTITAFNKGDRYIVPVGATGVWYGKDNFIVEYIPSKNDWYFVAPENGSIVFSLNNKTILTFDGVNWKPLIAHTILQQNGSYLGEFNTIDFNNEFDVNLNNNVASISLAPDYYQYKEDKTISVTTTKFYVDKLTLNTPVVPAGRYKIVVSYGWNHNSTTNDFVARVLSDGVQLDNEHQQEPKDAAGSFGTTSSNQKHYTTRIFFVVFNTDASHTITLQYKSSSSGVKSSIWDAKIEFWRIK